MSTNAAISARDRSVPAGDPAPSVVITSDEIYPAGFEWQRDVADVFGRSDAGDPGDPRPALNACRRIVHSQNGEDGVLEEIFARIGARNKWYVEFNAGDGVHISNTAHLRENHGWRGLLLEADADRVARVPEQTRSALNLHHLLVTPADVNDAFARFGVPRDCDLVSIDMGGHDYWVWRALEACRPRVVVIEYNSAIPNHVALAIHPDATPRNTDGYSGGNLRAMVRLAHRKRYRLLTTVEFNAVFVREEDSAAALRPGETLTADEDECLRRCWKPGADESRRFHHRDQNGLWCIV